MIVNVKACQIANVRKSLKTLKWTREAKSAKRLILQTKFIKWRHASFMLDAVKSQFHDKICILCIFKKCHALLLRCLRVVSSTKNPGNVNNIPLFWSQNRREFCSLLLVRIASTSCLSAAHIEFNYAWRNISLQRGST